MQSLFFFSPYPTSLVNNLMQLYSFIKYLAGIFLKYWKQGEKVLNVYVVLGLVF